MKIRRRAASISQNYNFFRSKTALQSVTEGLITARKMPGSQAEKADGRALDRARLWDRYDYYPHQLSGGQQQRVEIARAVVMGPEIILLDGPAPALVPELIGEVLEVMRKLTEEGMAMLVVTHEMSSTKNMGTKAIFMDKGVVVEENTLRESFESPRENRTRQFMSFIK